jgi:hypothetical protein
VKTLHLGLVLGATLFSACFSAEARSVPTAEQIDLVEASAAAVHVTATDYQFTLTAASAKAGTIDFVVSNDSLSEHEFMIVPFDDGRYGAPVGEIEPFGGGETQAVRATLTPGDYRFVCLIISVIDGKPKSDMARGMNVGFKVTH